MGVAWTWSAFSKIFGLSKPSISPRGQRDSCNRGWIILGPSPCIGGGGGWGQGQAIIDDLYTLCICIQSMRVNRLNTPGESSASIIQQQNREYEQSLQRDRQKVYMIINTNPIASSVPMKILVANHGCVIVLYYCTIVLLYRLKIQKEKKEI